MQLEEEEENAPTFAYNEWEGKGGRGRKHTSKRPVASRPLPRESMMGPPGWSKFSTSYHLPWMRMAFVLAFCTATSAIWGNEVGGERHEGRNRKRKKERERERKEREKERGSRHRHRHRHTDTDRHTNTQGLL